MKKEQQAVIEQRSTLSVALEITGTASIIQNCFSQKAIEEMLRKHMGLSVQREKKVPADCIERATIKNVKGKVCLPPTAIKKAMLTASASIKGMKKTSLRTEIFIEGGSIPFTFSQMIPRMNMVRTSGKNRTPDVRFRPEFQDWKARLIIQFSDNLPVQTVVDLLNRAGNVGVGEWRPEKDGTFGTFEVTRNITDPAEIKEVRQECRPGLVSLTIPEWAMNAELTPEILAKIARGDSENEPEEEEIKE